MLILKRASASRSFGQWRDDDYDVLVAATARLELHKKPRQRRGSSLRAP
jgi:hypothetical protein